MFFFCFAGHSQDIERKMIRVIDTGDKYVKIQLFDDYTWEYLSLDRPKIDSTALFDKYWDTSILHAYKGYPLDSIPAEVDLLLADETHHFCSPITGRIISGYKFRHSREHQGIDVPLHVGDTIRAAFDGVVRYVDVTRNTGGYGNLVIIRHPNGLETYYGHLSAILCNSGETVSAGEVIGLGGSTGRSTGPHLHFETRYLGQTFDPERVVDFENGALRDSLFTLKKHYFNIRSHYGQTDDESKAESEALYYKIRKGDTLGGIAAKYGTTVSKLCKLNGISSKKVLSIGHTLRVR